MSEKYKFNNPDGIYFTTSTVVDWIDVFNKPAYKLILLDSFDHCIKQKGLVVHAWCLMPNHLHAIISKKSDFTLSEIMRDFKKFTSKAILSEIQETCEDGRKSWMLKRFEFAGKYDNRIKNYKFWQEGNHPEELISNQFINQKLNYIHNNPVKDLIVSEAEDYLFSSARDYAGMKGMLDVELLV